MSAFSPCPECGEPGFWGFDDDWCHRGDVAALTCPREGWYPDRPCPSCGHDPSQECTCTCCTDTHQEEPDGHRNP